MNIKHIFIKDRNVCPFIKYLKRTKGKEYLTGAEIGVYRGYNAKGILDNLNIKKLYLIDPYSSYDNYDDGFGEHISNDEHIFNYKYARMLLIKYFNKIKFIKDFSENAVDKIPDNLDFVYIDGNHKYEYVLSDIYHYLSKVKHDGVLGGDNYEEKFNDVILAVDKFIGDNNFVLHEELGYWWINKLQFEG